MRKRIFAWMLVLAFVTLGITGCSNKKTDQSAHKSIDAPDKEEEKASNRTMGRYMEKEFSFPDLNTDEYIMKILRNAGQQFEVFTAHNSENGTEYYRYVRNEDMAWEKEKAEWLNDADIRKIQKNYMDLCLGEDGSYYVVYQTYEKDYNSLIIKSSGSENQCEILDLSYLKKEVKEIEGRKYYPMVQKLGVLKNGNLVISDAWEHNGIIILSPEGEKIDQIATDEYENFLVYGNKVITENEDHKIIIYNTEQQTIERELEYGGDSGTKVYALQETGTLFMGDEKGIHRMERDGTLWETTVDGALNSMSMPSLELAALFVSEGQQQEEYYAVYTDAQIGYQMKHYIFDPKVASVPEKEITVYSLQENKTVRQAISLFLAQNDNVKVNYVVAMGEEEGNVSDYIRALNTELLSGNGADILLLDGLPIDSYIEKGVLADISQIIDPLEQSGEILANLSAAFRTDGKVYRMPIRFGVPILLGKKEAVESSGSLEHIVEYINSSKGTYTGEITYAELLQDNFALYLKELSVEGKLDQSLLKQFLENIKIIAENSNATETFENSNHSNRPIAGFNSSNLLFQRGFSVVEDYDVTMSQVNNIADLMIPYELIKKSNLTLEIAGQSFVPKGLVALNSASKETEMAKAFIQFLFDSRVQETNLYDGFPVNSDSMKKWSEEHQDVILGVTDDKGNQITAEWPKEEERKAFLNEVLKVKTPLEINHILMNMILESAIPYLKGEVGIDQVTSEIMSKVNTYLEE